MRTHLLFDIAAQHSLQPSTLPPGQALREPAPLLKTLDESVVEEEYARLER